jgi:hypothetical protein
MKVRAVHRYGATNARCRHERITWRGRWAHGALVVEKAEVRSIRRKIRFVHFAVLEERLHMVKPWMEMLRCTRYDPGRP